MKGGWVQVALGKLVPFGLICENRKDGDDIWANFKEPADNKAQESQSPPALRPSGIPRFVYRIILVVNQGCHHEAGLCDRDDFLWDSGECPANGDRLPLAANVPG